MKRVVLVVVLLVVLSAPAANAVPYGRDVSQAAGIAQTVTTYGAAVDDFDSDGDEDFLLGLHGQAPAKLYRNDGANFTEVYAGTFFKKDRHQCAWGDANSDGRPDVYCTVGGQHGTSTSKANQLFIQQPGGGFIDRADVFGVTDAYARGRDATFFDANGDVHEDLYVANNSYRPDGLPSPNRVYINEGGSGFRSVQEINITERHVQAADYDADGDEDVLLSGQKLILLRNDGGTLSDVTSASGLRGRARQAVLADLDCNGLLDIARVDASAMAVRLQTADHRFGAASYSLPLTAGLSVAAGRIDSDCADDLYIQQTRNADGEQPDTALVNGGNGSTFSEASMDQTTAGAGESVNPINYDGDAATEFIVLNGERDKSPTRTGPVLLIDF
jgi:FG-GAP-like repeat